MFKRLINWIKKGNNCKKCPYYSSYFDSFIGDGDEFCLCGHTNEWAMIKVCHYPLFVRHVLAYIERKRQEKWDKIAEENFRKEEEEKAYKCLNLAEDIYLLLQESAEEIENLYGKETDLTEKIRNMVEKLEAI